jgi:hypothetical protein
MDRAGSRRWWRRQPCFAGGSTGLAAGMRRRRRVYPSREGHSLSSRGGVMSRTGPLFFLLLFAALAGSACAVERASPAGPESNAVVTVQSLATDAQRYLGQTIRVRGTLKMPAATTTDLRIQPGTERGTDRCQPLADGSATGAKRRVTLRRRSNFLGKPVYSSPRSSTAKCRRSALFLSEGEIRRGGPVDPRPPRSRPRSRVRWAASSSTHLTARRW